MKTATRKLEQELGKEPAPEEIADFMMVPAFKVESLLTISQDPLSLDAQANRRRGFR